MPQAEERRAPPLAELVVVFCLKSAPASCQEERPLLEPVLEPQCFWMGQIFAATWVEDHPKWMLKGWRCEEHAPERAL